MGDVEDAQIREAIRGALADDASPGVSAPDLTAEETALLLAEGWRIGTEIAVVIVAALEIPVRLAEAYAKGARGQVGRTDALTPILLHDHSARELAALQRANEAAAAAAEAFLAFRRVLEEVRASAPWPKA